MSFDPSPVNKVNAPPPDKPNNITVKICVC